MQASEEGIMPLCLGTPNLEGKSVWMWPITCYFRPCSSEEEKLEVSDKCFINIFSL